MTKEYLPYYVHQFELDGETVTVHIKRMDYGEYQDFSFRSAELEKTVLEERVFRNPEGPEQAKDDDGKFILGWEEICQRRLHEMPAEQREEIEKEQAARLREQDDFLRECIERYITHVEPGLVDVHHDGSKHAVKDGKGLVQITGGRRPVHLLLYQAIFAENHLDERQKKALKLAAGSSTSSAKSKTARRGRTRETTAESAVTSGSASNGHATRPRRRRSGSAGRKNSQSSSEAVPSSS